MRAAFQSKRKQEGWKIWPKLAPNIVLQAIDDDVLAFLSLQDAHRRAHISWLSPLVSHSVGQKNYNSSLMLCNEVDPQCSAPEGACTSLNPQLALHGCMGDISLMDMWHNHCNGLCAVQACIVFLSETNPGISTGPTLRAPDTTCWVCSGFIWNHLRCDNCLVLSSGWRATFVTLYFPKQPEASN